MFFTRFATATFIVLFSLSPALCHAQSIGDLLKLIPKSTSGNDIIGTIQSLSEITTGQVESGTGPENADGKIVLYRTASCPYCKRAAAYMRKRNIVFVERDIEKNSGYNAEFRRLGGVGVPFLVFREKTMGGFDEVSFDRNYTEFKHSMDNQPSSSSNTPTAVNNSLKNTVFQSGDIMVGKINGINVYVQPAKIEKLTVLGKTDEMIYMGKERDGFYQVTTQKGEGWVDKLLVKKQ